MLEQPQRAEGERADATLTATASNKTLSRALLTVGNGHRSIGTSFGRARGVAMQVGVSARAPRQASTDPRAMRPLAEGDLHVGVPLPYPLYDNHGRMLLAAGVVLEDADTLARLIARGVLRPTEAQALAIETAASERADPPVAADLVPFPALRRQVEALHVVLRYGGKLVTCASDYVGTLGQVSVITTVPRAEDQPIPVRERDDAGRRRTTPVLREVGLRLADRRAA